MNGEKVVEEIAAAKELLERTGDINGENVIRAIVRLEVLLEDLEKAPIWRWEG